MKTWERENESERKKEPQIPRLRPICKQEQTEREEDSPLEEFLEDLMEILDPNGPITTPVATIGVLGKWYFVITQIYCI